MKLTAVSPVVLSMGRSAASATELAPIKVTRVGPQAR